MNEIPLRIRAAAELERRRRQKRATEGGAIWHPDPRNKPQCLAYELAVSGQVMEIGYGGQAGGGKLLDINTPLPTPDGWVLMGDIAVGDVVIDEHGSSCNVTAISKIEFDTTYRLKFSDGSTIVAGASHLWVTETVRDRDEQLRLNDEWRERRRDNRSSRSIGKRPDLVIANQQRIQNYKQPSLPTTKTTQEIVDTLYVRGGSRVNHAILVCDPLVLPRAELPIDPYVLGVWLGDGTSSTGAVTGIDPEIFVELRQVGYTTTDHIVDKTKGVLGLHRQLRLAGLLNSKHIPNKYLRASIDQRLALLQGLMDTDGYCDPRGQCEFTTTSPAIRDGIYELITSLGIKVAIVTGRATLYGKDCGEKYRLKFITELPAFRLPRKLVRQKRDGFRGTHTRRYIVSAELIDPVPMRCIAVDSPSHLYLAGRAMIPTHNSSTLVGLAATAFNRSRIMRREFPQLDGLIEYGDSIFPSAFIGGIKKRWAFDGRTIALRSMPHDKDWKKYQGQPIEFLGIDEAAEFSETSIRNVTGWLRSAEGKHTLVVYATNPPTTPEGDWIIRYFAPWIDPQHPNPAEDGEIRWFAHIKNADGRDEVIECSNGEPYLHEASGRTIYPISRTFIHASRFDNPYLGEEYERRLQNLPEPLRTIVMDGDFTASIQDDLWQVIPTNWVLAAQERWRNTPKPNVALRAIGVDVAHGGADDSVIGQLYGVWFDNMLVYPGASTPDGETLAKYVDNVWDKSAPIAVDAIGYGASACDIMISWGMRPIPINFGAQSRRRDKSKRFEFFNQRAECWFALRDALDPASGENICLPPSRKLRADLCAPRYKQVRGKIQIEEKTKIKERLGRSPDEGDTAVLTWRAAQRMLAPIVLDFM